MESQWIDPFTLLPKRKPMKEYALKFGEKKLKLVIALCIISCVITLVLRTIQLIVQVCQSVSYRNQVIYIASCAIRIALYLLFIPLGKYSKQLQAAAITVLPIIYSVIITESTILADEPLKVHSKMLAAETIFLLALQYTLFNFLLAVVPFILLFAYPFARSLRTPV